MFGRLVGGWLAAWLVIADGWLRKCGAEHCTSQLWHHLSAHTIQLGLVGKQHLHHLSVTVMSGYAHRGKPQSTRLLGTAAQQPERKPRQ